MSAERVPRPTRDDYVFVGKELAPFEVELGFEQACELRDYVARDYFAAMGKKTRVPRLDESSDKTMAGKSFGPHPDFGMDLDVAVFVGASLKHELDDSWKLRLLTSRYRLDGTRNKVAARYHVDVIGGQVVQAKREVRIVRTRSDEFFDELLTDTPAHAERKMYERPLTEVDCDRVIAELSRVATRFAALGR